MKVDSARKAVSLGFLWAIAAISTAVAQEVKETPLKNREPSYIIETARNASLIQSAYPYDIQLLRAEGDTVISTDVFPHNGKPTVLLFWLTTCYPCRMELEALQKVYPEWQEKTAFNMIAISTDFPKNYAAFHDRVKQHHWPWPAFIDLNREFSKILPGGLNGLPQTFLLDKDGQIVFHKRKFRPGDELELFEHIKSLDGNK